jgi:hypothetical protein
MRSRMKTVIVAAFVFLVLSLGILLVFTDHAVDSPSAEVVVPPSLSGPGPDLGRGPAHRPRMRRIRRIAAPESTARDR